MSDFVVYEDSPLAEYLTSIDSGESLVKLAPLSLDTQDPNLKPNVSLITQLSESLQRYWRQSFFHDTFSTSLPVMEETAFEEKFKYLVVTSPLMNDTLSAHPKQKQMQQVAPHPFHTSTTYTRSAQIGTLATLSGLLLALGLEQSLSLHPKEITDALMDGVTPTITMALASGVSFYFVYRHLRRSSIRNTYQYALTQLQDILQQSQLFDSKVHRALLTIQEIELVSRGYRLSTPLSPISRIEQASKSKRCARLRSQLCGLLRHAFIVYEETTVDMTDWVNKQTLSRLFDMYNINSVASLSAADDEDGLTLDYLKTLAHLMHLKRRECILQFLALTIVTGDHDSIRKGYEAGWRNINTVLGKLGNETKDFVKTVKEAMETEFSKPSHFDLENKSDLTINTESRHFIHHLSTLDQSLRTMEARVHLCNDELQQRQRLLSKATAHEDHSLELEQQHQLLKKEYMTMEREIQQLVMEWEAGKTALDSLMAPSKIDTCSDQPSPASPLVSPTTPTNSDDDPSPFVVTCDDSSELFDLPLPSKASVYASVADVLESPTSTIGQNRKSRSERIAEMRQKREQEAKVKSTRMDSQNMVHELKNVLDRRILELDLADEG
ncbi:Mysoin-binding motif of peroxisomes-domain-containing protein [Chlamydoabsidia padenii]|nr:Mysoin-binding motif of peroxisomes-domain-containing protein [Chlamydoabsidia padenii]